MQKTANRFQRQLYEYFTASGQLALLLPRSARDLCERPRTLRSLFMLLVEQLLQLGARSLSLVLVAGIATGAVMAIQLGYSLQRFGANAYVPMIVGLSILRELGPILVSLLLAGRIGSGITSELASMVVTEQVDAVRALGDSPLTSLVVPRIAATLLAMPVLILAGDFIAVISASLVSWSQFGIYPIYFLTKCSQTLRFSDLFSGLIKGVVFGLLIAWIACWRGLRTAGGTRGVGRATTQVVVQSSIAIMLSDVFLSKLFVATGYIGR